LENKLRKLEADPQKSKALAEWPTSNSHKQLQRFLGFAHFYLRFIEGNSSIVAHLTKLTSTSVTFQWSREAETELKSLFVSAPILTQVDTSKQFIVTPAEQNYDVGNWDLLAIKLALEEWRH